MGRVDFCNHWEFALKNVIAVVFAVCSIHALAQSDFAAGAVLSFW